MNDLNHLDEQTLTDYVEDALAPAQREAAEAHLLLCDECAAQVAAFQELFSALSALPPLTLERDLAPAVMAAIQPAPMPIYQGQGLRWVIVAQVVVAALLLGALWQWLQPSLPTIEMATQQWWASLDMTPFLIQVQLAWDTVIAPLRQLQLPTFSDLTGIPALSWTTAAAVLLIAAMGWIVGNRWLLAPQSMGQSTPSEWRSS